jgi:hypothetical protein
MSSAENPSLDCALHATFFGWHCRDCRLLPELLYQLFGNLDRVERSALQ